VDMGKMLEPNTNKIIHAAIKIGDSVVMLVDEFLNCGSASPETLGGTPVTIHLYVEDAGSFVKKAVSAGAKVTMELMDAFWGDRYGKIVDPFGHEWSVATHIKDVTPKEMEEAARQMFSQQ
ncbi:MAG: VOC family protein, partial [Thermodesulfobacteriota bacterium]